jgi:uncharacterized membrane protein YqhA
MIEQETQNLKENRMIKLKKNIFYIIAAILGITLYLSFNSTDATNGSLYAGLSVVAGLVAIKTSKHLITNE